MKSTVFQLALVALFVAVASAAHIPGAETSKLSEGACDLCNSVVDNLMTLDLPEDVQVSKERCADIHDDFRQGCFELFENFDNADSLIAAEPSQACMHMGVCPLDDVSDSDTLVEDNSEAAPTESTAHDGDELMADESTEETGSSDPLASADPLVKSLNNEKDDDEDESSDDSDNDDDDDDDDDDESDVLASLSPNASPDTVAADTEPTALKLDEVEGMLELAPDNNDDDVLVSDDFDTANDDGTLASDKVVDQQLPSTQFAELAEEGQSSMADTLVSADDSEEAEVDDDAEEGDEDTAEAEDTTEGEDAEAEDTTEGEDAEAAEDTTEGEDAESDDDSDDDSEEADEEDEEGNVAHEINSAEPDASDDEDEDVLIGDFDSNIFTADNDSPAPTLGHQPVQRDNELEQEMYRDSIAEEKESEADVLVASTPSFLSEDATETDAEEMDSDAEEGDDTDDVAAAVDALISQAPETEDQEEIFNFETA